VVDQLGDVGGVKGGEGIDDIEFPVLPDPLPQLVQFSREFTGSVMDLPPPELCKPSPLYHSFRKNKKTGRWRAWDRKGGVESGASAPGDWRFGLMWRFPGGEKVF
jgi:hypothetical protein